MELGVIGFDIITYIEDDDNLIIVDAVTNDTQHNVGTVTIIKENELSEDLNLISQHDFGIEQMAPILRNYTKLKEFHIIGITVSKTTSFSNALSDELLEKIEEIKENVINNIRTLSNN